MEPREDTTGEKRILWWLVALLVAALLGAAGMIYGPSSEAQIVLPGPYGSSAPAAPSGSLA